MNEKKQLKDEELEKVSGGDDIVDLSKETIQEQEQERLQKLIEEAENNRQQRTSEDLNNSINNILNLLKKMNGDEEESDGQIHIG